MIRSGFSTVEHLLEAFALGADQRARSDPDAVEVRGELPFWQQQVDREQVLSRPLTELLIDTAGEYKSR